MKTSATSSCGARSLVTATLVIGFLQGFDAIGQQKTANPPDLAQTEARRAQRDSVDARAPENREATTILRRIAAQIEKGDWAAAIPQLQAVLDRKPGGMARIGPGEFVSVRTAANRLLNKMPREWRNRYIQQFEAVADRRLSEALAAGNYPAVAEVANRYRHTKSGARASQAIALRHLDRGEFFLALRWLEQLPDSDPGLTRLRTSILTSLSNETEVAEEDRPPQPMPSTGRPDWPMLMGSATRRGVSLDRLPVLVETWSQPLLDSEPVTANVQRVLRNVLDAQPGVVPAALPIVVNNRVACRTSTGVSVFDTQTGKLLWRSQREASTASTLDAAIVRSQYSRARSTSDERVQDFVFRDCVHGLLSSDGERVFVIEDQAMPRQSYSISRIQNNSSSRLVAESATNTLAAYNLETGSVEWRVGGVDSIEVFKPTLAGHYFHGVPAPYRDELFVVTERQNAVRLQVLDALTGEAKWSRLLAFVDAPIERDYIRRFLTAQVTVTQGIILCPTTADWLVAVDALTREILWVQRHQNLGSEIRARLSRRSRSTPALSTQWPASAPVVAGQTVIFTPPEASRIEALDLTSGARKWTAPKSNRSYLAGVTDTKAILVGKANVTAINVEDGRIGWSAGLPSDAFPTGRGAMSEGFLHQPLSSGQIVSINLATGKIEHETSTGITQPAGNMVMHANGMLIQSPTKLTALDLRPVENQPPKSLTDALKAAQIAIADSNPDDALSILAQFEPVAPESTQREQYLSVVKSALLARIQKGASDTSEDIDRLELIGEDKDLIARLRVIQQSASGDQLGAFRELIEMYESGTPDDIATESGLRVRRDLWISGKLFDAWKDMDAAARDEMSDAVTALSETDETRSRFLDVFGFHPAATEFSLGLLNEHLEAKRFCEAEKLLRRSRRYALEATKDMAFRCAASLANAGLQADAESMLREYGCEDRIADLPELEETEDRREKWSKMKWSFQHFTSGLSTARLPEIPVYRSDMQFHRDYLCLGTATGSTARVSFFSLEDEKFAWSLPLRTNSSVRSLIPNGRSLLVVHSNTISCVSPLERRVLWSQRLPGNAVRMRRTFHDLRSVDALNKPTRFSGRWRPVAIANEDYICIRYQGTIEVRDAVTGHLRWSRDDVSGSARVFGTVEGVFIEGLNQTPHQAFRSFDGQPIDAQIDDFEAVCGAVGQGLCLASSDGVVFKKQSIRLHNPTADSDIWDIKLTRADRVALIDDRELAIARGSDVELVDMVSGQVQTLQDAVDQTRDFGSVAATFDLVFVASSDKEPDGRVTEQALNGQLSVFDRETGQKRWEREVKQGSISVSFFRSQPVLVLTENRRQVGGLWVFDLVLLDRDTGTELTRTTAGGRYLSSLVTDFKPLKNSIDVGVNSSRKVRFIAKPVDADSNPKESP